MYIYQWWYFKCSFVFVICVNCPFTFLNIYCYSILVYYSFKSFYWFKQSGPKMGQINEYSNISVLLQNTTRFFKYIHDFQLSITNSVVACCAT